MGHGRHAVLNTTDHVFTLNIEDIFQLCETPIYNGFVGGHLTGLNNIFFVLKQNLRQRARVFAEAEVVFKVEAQPAIYTLFHAASKQPAIAFIAT